MAEVVPKQPESTFAHLQRQASEYRTEAKQYDRKMDKLNVSSAAVCAVGGALLSLALSTTPGLSEHAVPQTPIEWAEVGAEVAVMAIEAGILARTLQYNCRSNALQAQAIQAGMLASEIPPYQR